MLLLFRHQVTWSWSIHLCYSVALFLHICSESNQFCSNKHAYVLSHFSHVWLFVILWIITQEAPLSMRFSRQEYWSGLQYPPPGDLPDLGIEPASLLASALAGRFFTLEPPGKPLFKHIYPLKTYSFHQFHVCHLSYAVAVKYYQFHKILYLTT